MSNHAEDEAYERAKEKDAIEFSNSDSLARLADAMERIADCLEKQASNPNTKAES